MSLLAALFRPKQPEEPFNPDPGEMDAMPVRPYRVLHADLPFYSDPECKIEVPGARLIVLQCEDSRQKQRTIECMPTMKRYRKGQLVRWDINHKQQWEKAWYINPDTGQSERAWALAMEFLGPVANERVAASALESKIS
jgi:hypothetical protein